MEEWKKDVESRVKIIQKKAMDLLDREEKLRKKEEELRALASQLGVNPRRKSETTRTRYRLREASARGLADRLVEILDQIVGILEAHTDPHEPFGNPARHPL